jgi:uncharacterized protein (DUF983 family)
VSENNSTGAIGAQVSSRRDLNQAMRRGAFGTCPNCGKGALFRAYLKQVDVCKGCGEELAHIRADDGPAWLTVLIVGHLVVFLAMIVDAGATWPVWWSVGMFSVLSLVLVLLLLQPAKGIFIGAIWASRLTRPDQL